MHFLETVEKCINFRSSITSSPLKAKHLNRRRQHVMTSTLKSTILWKSKWTAFCCPPTAKWKFRIWITKFTRRWIRSIRWKLNGNSTWVSPKTRSFSSISGSFLNREIWRWWRMWQEIRKRSDARTFITNLGPRRLSVDTFTPRFNKNERNWTRLWASNPLKYSTQFYLKSPCKNEIKICKSIFIQV